ncbi:molybdopterin-dependent oxidoreductase [Denitrobacterium detoxificans]|jgi:anaerobic selenocysteine-containing dehydrogenase|uniref:molybdopterin-containing oxidoreductase family protein n=1 Tax=Denitrobacterium detoxificans TaxID=79604 RepID=UPI0026F01B2C|nr:molybdopterin-dependent oxidoreductase [Denitrobacterium detoxificans]MBE6466611.1 dehydrogenase [Denitrobacterium detoxificans]
MTIEMRKGNCSYCGYLCGLTATVEDGRITDIAPDPTRYPYDASISSRCRRWRMNLDDLDAPDRLNYPLRRVGERGSGKFERVTWDEALDDIASRLEGLRGEYGARTLASAIAGPHTTYWPLHRFMNQFGSPNNMGIGQICWDPRIFMDAITFGWPTDPDLNDHTQCIMLWATNPAISDNSLFWSQIKERHAAGVPLVVVDCRATATARQADVHLAPWPGTDPVLALSLLNVIIEEGLFDREFVSTWCVGFSGLREHVRSYEPERAQELCGVPAENIRKAARLYATHTPGVLLSGRGIDQLGPNAEPTVRSLCLLRALTGNVDRPGACFLHQRSSFRAEAAMERPDLLSQEDRAWQLNTTPLQSYSGYNLINDYAKQFGSSLPERYLSSAHPGMVMRAMVTGEPYPIRALFVMGANPVLTYANTKLVLEALQSLDLCVVVDYRLTPTAQLADYVLPAAGALERPNCQIHGGVADFAYGGAAVIPPLHERRNDYDIMRELALRLGMGAEWPHATLEEELDYLFEPVGITFEQFANEGMFAPAPTFRKHEQRNGQGKPRGFATPSGKVELASSLIEQLGGSAYPQPISQSIPRADLATGKVVLITGARSQPFWGSSYFHNQDFRQRRPYPRVTMAPTTARALGLAEGDWARLSNKNGSAVFNVAFQDMPEGVASAEYGWWLPETPPGAPGFSGSLTSNINMLTDNGIEGCEPLIGTWTYNGIEALVEKTSRPIEFDSASSSNA